MPLVKYTDDMTGYHVDISMNQPGGIESAKIVKQFLHDPACAEGLKPLLLILKQWLSRMNLNEVYSGGLGSYALLSMVACFLKVFGSYLNMLWFIHLPNDGRCIHCCSREK